ncbi:MAG: hypothetical protein CVU56_20265 [Deltaproteobacteria bacterium HGW-Deltaproteobacteria-14]|jgi:hypothetical protein|nr:MAG: hypothetical protein CVU56_20265 [Deltaproteobacteria bacterium HGW-Deltaproteobacteria-14]
MADPEIEGWEELPEWQRVHRGLGIVYAAMLGGVLLSIAIGAATFFSSPEGRLAALLRVAPILELALLAVGTFGAWRATAVSPAVGARRLLRAAVAAGVMACIIKAILLGQGVGTSLEALFEKRILVSGGGFATPLGDVASSLAPISLLAGLAVAAPRLGAPRLATTALVAIAVLVVALFTQLGGALSPSAGAEWFLGSLGLTTFVPRVVGLALALTAVAAFRTHLLAGTLESNQGRVPK